MLSNPDVNPKNGVAYKKNRISDFKHPGDLNEILIKGNISIKNEQKEAEMLMSVVSNPVKDLFQIIKHTKFQFRETFLGFSKWKTGVDSTGRCIFLHRWDLTDIGIDSDALKWDNTIDEVDM